MAESNSRSSFLSLLDIETQWILHCCSSRNLTVDFSSVHLDWAAFLKALKSHRMTNTVYENTKGNEQIPKIVRQQWRTEFVANKHRMLHYTAELNRIISLLQKKNIDTIALKGPMLGHIYYDDYSQRECNDLDILVKPSDLSFAYELLIKEGYQTTDTLWKSPGQKKVYLKTFHHYSLYNPENDIFLELHWRLNSLSLQTNEEYLWRHATTQKIRGIDITLLSAHDNFLYLCVHGGRHQWKRLFWVQDIARIIEKEGETFINDAYQLSKQQKSGRYVLLALQLASLLFDVRLPENIVRAIKSDDAIAGLTEIALFSIRMTASPDLNPLSSFSSFNTGIQKLINHYSSVYYLGGAITFKKKLTLFFINPRYWRIYAFQDSLFYLNYLAAPFLWMYSVSKKYLR